MRKKYKILWIIILLSLVLIVVGCESKEVKIEKILKSAETFASQNDYKQIYVSYNNAVKIDDSGNLASKIKEMTKDTLVRKVEGLIVEKKFDTALKEIEKCIEEFQTFDPLETDAISSRIHTIKKSNDAYELGLDYFNKMDYDQALLQFTEVSSDDLSNINEALSKIEEIKDIKNMAYIKESEELFRAKNYDEAIKKIDLAISYRDNPDTRNLKDQYVKAQEEAKKAEEEKQRKLEEQRKAEEEKKRQLAMDLKPSCNQSGYYGYVNLDRTWIIKPQYYWAGKFISGEAPVVTIKQDIIVINKKGEIVRKIFDYEKEANNGEIFSGANQKFARTFRVIMDRNASGIAID